MILVLRTGLHLDFRLLDYIWILDCWLDKTSSFTKTKKTVCQRQRLKHR